MSQDPLLEGDRSGPRCSIIPPCEPLIRVDGRLRPLEASVKSMEQRVMESALQVNRDLTVLTTNVSGLTDMVRGMVGKMDGLADGLNGLTAQMARTNEQVISSQHSYEKLDDSVTGLRSELQKQSVEIARLQGADSTIERVDGERIRISGHNQYWILPFLGFLLSVASGILLHFLLQ